MGNELEARRDARRDRFTPRFLHEARASTYLDAMLEAVELPARVADLDSGLANVDADALTHLGGLLACFLGIDQGGRLEAFSTRRKLPSLVP